MKTLLTITVCILFSFEMACGVSPALNHTSAAKNRSLTPNAQPLNQASPSEKCDLSFATENKCARIQWTKTPNRDNEGEFKLYFWKKGQSSESKTVYTYPTAHTVFVKLWMTSMGHGSQRIVLTKNLNSSGAEESGIFLGSQVYFVMGGAWDIIVQLKNAQGAIIDEAKIPYQAQ